MFFKVDDYAYYSSVLTEEQSSEIKEMTGFSSFESLYFLNYNRKLPSGFENYNSYTFTLSIHKNEYDRFIDYIIKLSEKDKGNLNITLIDDSVILNDFNYEFKIKYFEHDYSDLFYYTSNGKIKYSIEAYVIFLKLLLIILANCLIILPYKRIITFAKKKISPQI